MAAETQDENEAELYVLSVGSPVISRATVKRDTKGRRRQDALSVVNVVILPVVVRSDIRAEYFSGLGMSFIKILHEHEYNLFGFSFQLINRYGSFW